MSPEQNSMIFAMKRSFLCAFIFLELQFPLFSSLYHTDKIMSAESEWNLIVLLQRQGKDCISMKWAIDLSDESLVPRWACHAAQFLWEPAAVKMRQMIYTNYLVVLQWQYYYFV